MSRTSDRYLQPKPEHVPTSAILAVRLMTELLCACIKRTLSHITKATLVIGRSRSHAPFPHIGSEPHVGSYRKTTSPCTGFRLGGAFLAALLAELPPSVRALLASSLVKSAWTRFCENASRLPTLRSNNILAFMALCSSTFCTCSLCFCSQS